MTISSNGIHCDQVLCGTCSTHDLTVSVYVNVCLCDEKNLSLEDTAKADKAVLVALDIVLIHLRYNIYCLCFLFCYHKVETILFKTKVRIILNILYIKGMK